MYVAWEFKLQLDSFEKKSEPRFCKSAYGRNSLQGLKLWQVLGVGFACPLSKRVLLLLQEV